MLWPIININSKTKSLSESSISPKSGIRTEAKFVEITLQVLMSESLLVNANQDLSWPPNRSQPHRHVPRISWLESIADESQKTAWSRLISNPSMSEMAMATGTSRGTRGTGAKGDSPRWTALQ